MNGNRKPPTRHAQHAHHPAPAPGSQAARLHQTEMLLSWLLRTGVVLSMILVAIGLILSFHHHPEWFRRGQLPKMLSGNTEFPVSVGDVAASLGRLEGRGFVSLGLLVLIITPVLRVAASIFSFMHLHNPRFVVMTTIVLILLLLSFFLGRAGG